MVRDKALKVGLPRLWARNSSVWAHTGIHVTLLWLLEMSWEKRAEMEAEETNAVSWEVTGGWRTSFSASQLLILEISGVFDFLLLLPWNCQWQNQPEVLINLADYGWCSEKLGEEVCNSGGTRMSSHAGRWWTLKCRHGPSTSLMVQNAASL